MADIAEVPLPIRTPLDVKVVAPVPPYATPTVVPFHVPLVKVPTVVSELEPAKGDAPTLLYDIVCAAEPLNVVPEAAPEPLLLKVSALVTLPA